MVKTLVITGYGINCEKETARCFQLAGSDTEILHINEIISKPDYLRNFHLLAIPGGFSFGDHIASGRILANKLKFFLWNELTTFITSGKGIIGICNGFQILIKSGILPGWNLGQQEISITHNQHGRFEDRWVKLGINSDNVSFWLNGFEDYQIELPIRHGEGRVVVSDSEQLEKILTAKKLVALNYQDEVGELASRYPDNPNGSVAGIAGLTNEEGNVLGLMPHPEAYMIPQNAPNFGVRRERIVRELESSGNSFLGLDPDKHGLGMKFFFNGVQAMKEKFGL